MGFARRASCTLPRSFLASRISVMSSQALRRLALGSYSRGLASFLWSFASGRLGLVVPRSAKASARERMLSWLTRRLHCRLAITGAADETLLQAVSCARHAKGLCVGINEE